MEDKSIKIKMFVSKNDGVISNYNLLFAKVLTDNSLSINVINPLGSVGPIKRLLFMKQIDYELKENGSIDVKLVHYEQVKFLLKAVSRYSKKVNPEIRNCYFLLNKMKIETYFKRGIYETSDTDSGDASTSIWHRKIQ